MPLTNIEIIAYSTVLAGAITLIISAYFHYVKPSKSDVVFVANRNSWLEKILSQMEIFDNQYLQYVFDRYHKAGFDLKRSKNELGTSIKFVNESELDNQDVTDFMDVWNQDMNLKKIGDDLEGTYKQMKYHYDNFFADKILHERYFHHDIIREMDLYFWNGLYYVEWLRKGGVHVSSCIDSRKNIADKIIKYVEKDSSFKIQGEKIKKWIEDWKDELKRGY